MKAKLLALVLTTSLLFNACHPTHVSEPEDNQAFQIFAETLFRSEISDDSLSLHYTLKHPQKAGITTLPRGFSSFSHEDLTQAGYSYENTLATLQQFCRDSLTKENQILYDVLEETLRFRIQGQKFVSFSEALGPTTGIQAQLPVLLAEFRLDSKQDVEQYFFLLRTLPDYFDSLLALEKKKCEWGTLFCRSTLEHIISQCETFQKEKGSNILRKTFNNKLKYCSFFTDEEKTKACRQLDRYVTDYVDTAYQSLLSGLKQLLPLAKENGSLSSYENGTAYYEYLVSQTTGSSFSIAEWETNMKRKLKSAEETLLSYAAKDPNLFSSCQSYTTKYRSPNQILAHLERKIQEDFPLLSRASFEVKYVDEALEDYLSPAFYLTPPVDDSKNNIIYINPSEKYDPSSLFNTLAHEGYPGHLYQTCYMYEKNLPNLRSILNFGGYTEGWATYAEIYSYKYTGVTKDEVGILRNNMIASLCLYGLCDIGVHYRGWNLEKLENFLQKHGGYSSDAAATVYHAVVDEPASYLKYTVGYLEFSRLKELAKKTWGPEYSEKNFHCFVLDMGPMSFSLLEKYLHHWKDLMGTKSKQSVAFHP